jgi:transcription-repair coupling factor (superfamily II helicase)
MPYLSPISPEIPSQIGQKISWAQPAGCGLSLAISHAAQSHAGPTLVLCEDSHQAQQLLHELHFFNAGENIPVMIFPDWETLPYDNFSAHQDIISERLRALYRLPSLKKGILLVPIKTAAQRLCPRSFLEQSTFLLQKGETVSIDKLRHRLENAGYRSVAQVMEHGEYAVRGSLFDLFPMGSHTPFRIDLFDEEVDSIRIFDVESQRSTDKIDQIQLLPAREMPTTDEAITLFRQQWRRQFEGNPNESPLYEAVSKKAAPPGIEYYLPLFYEQTSTLFEHCPENTLVIAQQNVVKSLDDFWQEINLRYEELRHDRQRPLLPPAQLFLATNELFSDIKQFARIQVTKSSDESATQFAAENVPELPIDSKMAQPLHKLQAYLMENPGQRILFCADSAGRRETLVELLSRINIHPTQIDSWKHFFNGDNKFAISIASIEQGLKLPQENIILISEALLYGQQVMQRRRRKQRFAQTPETIVRDLAELRPGAPIVHLEHGIGIYQGLQILSINNEPAEFLMLQYAGDDKLYVPVSSLHLISRYCGADADHVQPHKLGSGAWQKAKKRAAEKIRDVAAELLHLYAKRAAKQGYAFPMNEEEYSRFAQSFPFEETPDQERAIHEVVGDMTSSHPMDRLVCGDVGFGKTEVALRAAFVAVHGRKQVAVLVPTTLLAQQHYETFKDRFADWPVNIEVLSRFKSAKEQTVVLEKLSEGKVDIIIGTHKLLSDKVQFQDLGLIIIDEEHRFGVKHKEKMKELRAEVDILTLTATPIPRTLNMALAAIRDLSIISTPPQKRLSIKTFVRERNRPLIREAILREIMRGGQVYYLHNDIDTIEATSEEIAALVPEGRVSIAHGQMPERQLERIMSDFYHAHFSILISTTIIETGIDIPNANTIIMDRADKLGLAQMHQLRGRVGRSHRQAYAYLFTPPEKTMTKDAQKRLDAISSLEDLGAGFTLATHDLEIRGTGELLGEEQSGHISEIGFSLYMELLEKAVEDLKSGRLPDLEGPLNFETEIDLQIPALIPESYLADINTRLTLYKRIASADNEESLNELEVEMIDRFGALPDYTKNLFTLTRLRLAAKKIGVRKVDANAQGGRLEFYPDPKINAVKLIEWIQKQPQHFKMEGRDRLKFIFPLGDRNQRLEKVREIVENLSVG